MSEDQFTRLFNYMQEQFDSIERKLDEKASQSSIKTSKSIKQHSTQSLN